MVRRMKRIWHRVGHTVLKDVKRHVYRGFHPELASRGMDGRVKLGQRSVYQRTE